MLLDSSRVFLFMKMKGEMMNFLVDCSGIKEAGKLAACVLILARSVSQEKEANSGKHVHPSYIDLTKFTVRSLCLAIWSIDR